MSAAKFCVTHFHTCRSVQVQHSTWIQMDRFGISWLISYIFSIICCSQLYLALRRATKTAHVQLFVSMKAKRNTSAPFPITNQTLSNSSNKLKTNPSKVHTSTRKTTPSAKVQLLALHGYTNLHETEGPPCLHPDEQARAAG